MILEGFAVCMCKIMENIEKTNRNMKKLVKKSPCMAKK